MEIAVEYIERIPDNLQYWKWVIIGIHNCLQSFMVLALRGSTPVNIMSEKKAKQWLKAYDEKIKFPNYYLDKFSNLYEKIKSDRMLMYTNSKKFEPSVNQDRHVSSLNQFRNAFVHFKVSGWSIYVGGMKNIILDILKVIEFLAFDSNNLSWPNEQTQEEVQRLLLQGRKNLEEL